MFGLACGLTLNQLQGHGVYRHRDGSIALPIAHPVAHTGASRLEQETAEEAIASLHLFRYAGGRENKPNQAIAVSGT